MLTLSRKSLLALEAVVDIALHARPDPVQAREITKRQGVPQRYLEQVMQALVRANILRGVRGPRGGYRLARERRRISVKEVITVIEALESEETMEHFNSPLSKQIIAPLCIRLQRAIDTEMGGITIADLCTGINQPDQESDNFTI
tara:strand:- start:416 stop:850 length:435 start_codon:yes stop_codon:yes gene_type:complete